VMLHKLFNVDSLKNPILFTNKFIRYNIANSRKGEN